MSVQQNGDLAIPSLRIIIKTQVTIIHINLNIELFYILLKVIITVT